MLPEDSVYGQLVKVIEKTETLGLMKAAHLMAGRKQDMEEPESKGVDNQ